MEFMDREGLYVSVNISSNHFIYPLQFNAFDNPHIHFNYVDFKFILKVSPNPYFFNGQYIYPSFHSSFHHHSFPYNRLYLQNTIHPFQYHSFFHKRHSSPYSPLKTFQSLTYSLGHKYQLCYLRMLFRR